MKLRDYLDGPEITAASLGRKVGVSHSTILRWANGSMQPSMGRLRDLSVATGGKVQPNDFLEGAA